jgi:hypothetical protein
MSSGYRGDLTGRVLGALTFLVGVAMLGTVFYVAYLFFHMSAEKAIGLTFTGNPKLDPPAMKVAIQFGWLLVQVALMFIMAIVGSLTSQKGINFYFSAIKGIALDMTPKVSSAPPPTS